MKKTTLLTSNLFVLIFLVVFSTKAENPEPNLSGNILSYGKYRKDIGINIDMGLNGSGDYRQVIIDHFNTDETSGGFLWLSMGIGLDFRVINNLFIQPRISWLTSMLSYPSSLTGFNNETVNDLFLPGIGAKYYIFIKTPGSAHNEYANLGLYFDGRVYKNIPNTELTDFSFSSAGAAKNLAVGLHVGLLIGSLNLELGNRWIPVRINNEPSTKNFGGIYAEMSGVIYLFNYSGIKEKFKR